MTARVTLVLLLIGMVGSTVASAQYGGLARDTRVRVLAPAFSESRPVGNLAGVDSTGLFLVKGRADTLFIPRDAVMAVDVSAGKRSHWVRGAAIGGLSGLGLATVAWIADNVGDEDDPFTDAFDEAFFVVAATALGVGGALVGGIIGAVARTEQWDRVPASEIRWAVVPTAHGVRVGFSLRL